MVVLLSMVHVSVRCRPMAARSAATPACVVVLLPHIVSVGLWPFAASSLCSVGASAEFYWVSTCRWVACWLVAAAAGPLWESEQHVALLLPSLAMFGLLPHWRGQHWGLG